MSSTGNNHIPPPTALAPPTALPRAPSRSLMRSPSRSLLAPVLPVRMALLMALLMLADILAMPAAAPLRADEPIAEIAAAAAMPPAPPESNVALAIWGSEARGSGQPFNPAYDVSAAIDGARSPALFGSKPRGLVGGAVIIRLALSTPVSAVALTQSADAGRFDRARLVEVAVDGLKVALLKLDDRPEVRQRFPLEARGQEFRFTVTDKFDDPETEFGGWNEIEILTAEDLSAKFEPPESFRPSSAAYVQSFGHSAMALGKPLRAAGHPRTLWSRQELAEARRLLGPGPQESAALRRLLQRAAALAQEELAPPAPQEMLDQTTFRRHMANADAIVTLGLAWAVTAPPSAAPDDPAASAANETTTDNAAREEPVGAADTAIPAAAAVPTARDTPIAPMAREDPAAVAARDNLARAANQLLLAYAAEFPEYQATGSAPWDRSRLFNHRAELAVWLMRMASGYDLLHDSLKPEERLKVAALLREAALVVADDAESWRWRSDDMAANMAAVLVTGYAIDDEELISWGLDGRGGQGGAYQLIDQAVTGDGAWLQEAITAPGRTAELLVMMAECAWRNGVDLYSFRDARLKKLCDAPLELSYPDLQLPNLYRFGSETLLGPQLRLYDYAYRRYGDPRHLWLADHLAPAAGPAEDLVLPAPLPESGRTVLLPAAPPVAGGCGALLASAGLAVLRSGHGAAENQLLMVYGDEKSPTRVDVLGLDLYGLGRPLLPCPGAAYNNEKAYNNWFRRTVAHNTLTVDERTQTPSRGELVTLAATGEVAVVRARTARAYPGVAIDRTVVLTRDYAIDLAATFSRTPRLIDLVYHSRGAIQTDLRLDAANGPLSKEPGYSQISRLRHGRAVGQWQIAWRDGDRPPLTIIMAGDPPTAAVAPLATATSGPAAGGADKIVVTDGTEIFTGLGLMGHADLPLVLQRRQAAETAFAAVVNLNQDPQFVGTIAWLETGSNSARALRIETRRGTDYLIVNYRSGQTVVIGDLATDADLALVRFRRLPCETVGPSGLESFYLAGGRRLKLPGGTVELSHAALVTGERVENGNFVIRNLGPAGTVVRIGGLDLIEPTSSAAAAPRPLALDELARPTGRLIEVDWQGPAATAFSLAAGSGAEFGPAGPAGSRTAAGAAISPVSTERQLRADERLRAALTRVRTAGLVAAERADRNEEEANRNPVTPETAIVIEAESFKAEGGDKVQVTEKKVGARRKSFLSWDEAGHWLEWRFDCPESGYYQVMFKYCTKEDRARRRLEIDGQVPDPALADFPLPPTGGWANSLDDWRLATLADYRLGRPVLVYLNKGPHTLRLTNLNRSVNLDYIVVASPDLPADRGEFE